MTNFEIIKMLSLRVDYESYSIMPQLPDTPYSAVLKITHVLHLAALTILPHFALKLQSLTFVYCTMYIVKFI